MKYRSLKVCVCVCDQPRYSSALSGVSAAAACDWYLHLRLWHRHRHRHRHCRLRHRHCRHRRGHGRAVRLQLRDQLGNVEFGPTPLLPDRPPVLTPSWSKTQTGKLLDDMRRGEGPELQSWTTYRNSSSKHLTTCGSTWPARTWQKSGKSFLACASSASAMTASVASDSTRCTLRAASRTMLVGAHDRISFCAVKDAANREPCERGCVGQNVPGSMSWTAPAPQAPRSSRLQAACTRQPARGQPSRRRHPPHRSSQSTRPAGRNGRTASAELRMHGVAALQNGRGRAPPARLAFCPLARLSFFLVTHRVWDADPAVVLQRGREILGRRAQVPPQQVEDDRLEYPGERRPEVGAGPAKRGPGIHDLAQDGRHPRPLVDLRQQPAQGGQQPLHFLHCPAEEQAL
eukprot:SAG22_NODE_239_length_14182_cov_74.353050_3_plen_402_part_00